MAANKLPLKSRPASLTAANVEKCRKAGLDRIVVLTTSAQADRKIRDRLADTPEVRIIEAPAAVKQKW